MRADLHTHSYYSDGLLSPEDIVLAAKNNGVQLIALTDHDTMHGCAEFSKFAQANGLKSVNGVEVSAYYKQIKFHTLGYNIDKQKFQPFLNELFENSIKRTQEVVFKHNGTGIKINMEDVDAQRRYPSTPMHAMHVARAMVKRGYCNDVRDFFRNYVDYGKPAFIPVYRPTPEETCEAISYAGGFAAVAHPARIHLSAELLKNIIIRLKGCGLGGIEVYYTTHTEEQTTYYKNLAESLNLLMTGGSDTHMSGPSRKVGTPEFYANKELLERLGIKQQTL